MNARITSIELAGTSNLTLRDGTPGLPRAFAKIGRKNGDDFFTVEILAPGIDRTHHVQADCDEDIQSMADCLQQTLDGYEGTNSERNEYYRILENFAD